jgi:mRNA interferase RelE/StbE
MGLEIKIADEAEDFLREIPSKHARQIVSKIESLAENPRPIRSKELEGYAPLLRLRSGDYRIVYFVEGDILKVPIIDKRSDDAAYRRVARTFRP